MNRFLNFEFKFDSGQEIGTSLSTLGLIRLHTPGHTFCKQCLETSLSVSRECTLCKAKIFESSFENLQINFLVQDLIEKKYPDVMAMREREFNELRQKREIEIK